MNSQKLISKIKQTIIEIEPDAKVILYGSFARCENKEGSDIDLIILINRQKITISDEKRIKYPLYDLEFETGQIISPLIFSENEWNTAHRLNPFFENVKSDGKVI